MDHFISPQASGNLSFGVLTELVLENETQRLIDCKTLMIKGMKQNYFLLGENALISYMQQKMAGPYGLSIIAREMHLSFFASSLLLLRKDLSLLTKMYVFVEEESKLLSRVVYCLF